MSSKNISETLKQYWQRRVLLPSLIAASVLAAILCGVGIREIRNEREKHAHFVLKTVAMLASDPILLGDYLELSKRVSTVASKYEFDIEVVAADGRILSKYPNVVSDTQLAAQVVRLPIQSTDGRTIGFLSGGPHHSSLNLDMVWMGVLAVIIVVVFLFLVLIRAIEPIASDILALSSEVDEENGVSLPKRYFEIEEIDSAFKKIIAVRNTKLELERSRALGNLASQVAHDIRSPLSALTMAEKEFAKLPEETRLIVRSAVGRIRDIANTLLERNRALKVNQGVVSGNVAASAEPKTIQLLSAILDGIVSEKRMQFRPKLGMNIEFEDTRRSYGRFASIQTGEFKRMVSNLINNAVEALPDAGQVFVTLNGGDSEVVIKVRDTGKGIPAEVLAKLGRQGETHGKADGNGLGLYHARTQCEAWGGSLAMTSQVGEGTIVTITLPRALPPEWFVAELKLEPNSTVVVLDDDDSIHRIWQGRAESEKLLEQGISLVHLSTPSDIHKWHSEWVQKGSRAVQYLCDYELLGFDETGLDLIEKLGIANQSILVTSRYEEPSLRERCNTLKMSLIPKGMAGFVPISVMAEAADASASKTPDAILIDDDDLIHLTWKAAAKRKGLMLLGFKSVDEFLQAAGSLNRLTPVYIDSYLGNDAIGKPVQGEEVSREISSLGFEMIYLATGLAPANPERYTWLTGIRDKDPPFDEVTAKAATIAPPVAEIDYAKVRNYFHDLLKPVQQTSNILRLINNVNFDDGTDSDSLSDYFSLLAGVGKALTSQRNHRLQMRNEMTKADLARVASLDERLMKAYDEVERSVVCSPDQIVGLKRSEELSQRFNTIQAESSALAWESAVLLNSSRPGMTPKA